MPIGSLIKLPVDIDHQTAAAMTMRGLSAAYWLLKTNPVDEERATRSCCTPPPAASG